MDVEGLLPNSAATGVRDRGQSREGDPGCLISITDCRVTHVQYYLGHPVQVFLHHRGATLARLGIGSVAGNREILGPLAKQLEDRHLSPMHNTPPERQMQPKRRMPREDDDDGEAFSLSVHTQPGVQVFL